MATKAKQEAFRLWLDTNYDVASWPYKKDWKDIVKNPPKVLKNAIDDFDIFLPEDHINFQHGNMPRAHASARTEMAVYKRGKSLLILLRMWDGKKIGKRFAPPRPEGGQVLVMGSTEQDEALYVGIDPDENYIVSEQYGLRPDSSEVSCGYRQRKSKVRTMAAKQKGCWLAGFQIPLAEIPGYDEKRGTLAFTAGRLWGESWEPICWSSPIVWAPMLPLMGTLHLKKRQASKAAKLYRADFAYNAETETGELIFKLNGKPRKSEQKLQLLINTAKETAVCRGNTAKLRWQPNDGKNSIGVKVGEEDTIYFDCEKWPDDRLIIRAPYPLADRPSRNELATLFAKWHRVQDKQYVAKGTWCIASVGKKMRYGFDHHCAFPMEPYAYACLHLDRKAIYEARVRESCDRIASAAERDNAILCYHFSDHPAPFEGGAFGHGSASEALCLGYRVLNDKRYLNASIAMAKRYVDYPLENNTNYIAFVLWHLVELYELTGEREHMDRAVWYAEHGVLRGLTPGGNFPGHNYYSGYGNITLKGMAKLYRILPAKHALKKRLGGATLRFTNQLLSRLRADGYFEGRNRMYFGHRHTMAGLFEVAFAFGKDIAKLLDPVLCSMLRAHDNADKKRRDADVAGRGLVIALMARHLGLKAK